MCPRWRDDREETRETRELTEQILTSLSGKEYIVPARNHPRDNGASSVFEMTIPFFSLAHNAGREENLARVKLGREIFNSATAVC